MRAPIPSPYREYTAPESQYDIDITLLRAAYDRARLNMWLTLAATMLFSPLLWEFLPHIWVTVWVVALALNVAVSYVCWVLFQQAKPSLARIALWQKILVAQSALGGASWAIGPVLMIPQASPVDVAIFFGTLVIVSAVVAISMAGQRMAMQIYILFTMLPVAVAIGLNGSIEERTLGLGMGVGTFILISVGRHADRMARRELKTAADRARFEERRYLGEQIAQLDRQRSLGELSASLGHELIQPLTAILTNAQVVQRGLQSGRFDVQQHTEFNRSIILNTKRAAEIIERIRTFIRPSAMRLEPVDLRDVAHDVASLVASDVRRNKVVLDMTGCEPGCRVMGDPIQLSQIVLNVFRNALDAMGQSTERQLRVSSALMGGRAILRMDDTGPGLTPEDLAKVGTPFFTTKTAGLGMGISISRAIAGQHGGSLTLANGPQGGCMVVLNLPAIAATSPYAL